MYARPQFPKMDIRRHALMAAKNHFSLTGEFSLLTAGFHVKLKKQEIEERMQKFHAKGQLSNSGKHITLSRPKLTGNVLSYFSLIKGLLGDCHQFLRFSEHKMMGVAL